MSCPIGRDVDLAAAILVEGGLVAFATETVYGLGADAFNARAIVRVFEAKERPQFDPLIVHVADESGLPRVVQSVPKSARRLIDRFWPGPLTLVLPKQAAVSDLVTAGLPTVGVRIPAHPLALELLRRAARPIAAPSANLFGQVSPTTAQHVADQLGDRIDYILDGGACGIGVESTVLDLCESIPKLLRPGGLSLEQLEAEIGPVMIADFSSEDSLAHPAPGMSLRHYATRTPLVLAAPETPLPDNQRLGLLSYVPELSNDRFVAVEVLSIRGDMAEAAANLFAAMRRLDELSLDLIIARPVENAGLGRAINNRLERAARMAHSRSEDSSR